MLQVHCAVLLISLAIIESVESHEGRQRFDGWFNNFVNAHWGGVGDDLIFTVPPAYEDMTYSLAGAGRPNPRVISNNIFRGPSGLPSYHNNTAMFAFFGQMVSFELYDALEYQCPIELYKIPIPDDDPDFNRNKTDKNPAFMPFVRAGYNLKTGHSPNSPRRPVNQASSWIDGSFIYGCGEVWGNCLREFVGGRLVSDNTSRLFPGFNNVGLPIENKRSGMAGGHGQEDSKRLWMFGDRHAHENPALSAIAIVWFRYHNYLADRIQKENPSWKDEHVFQTARRRVIATLQQIVMYEYLPALIRRSLPPYTTYKAHIQPSLSAIFASAASKVVNSQIPPGVYLRDRKCSFKKKRIRLCNSYFHSQWILEKRGINDVVMGLASQIGEREDHIVVNDLRGNLFAATHFTRHDEVTLTIMQGRDHGLPEYNTAREAFRLPRVRNWHEINPWLSQTDPKIIKRLMSTYNGSLSMLDIYTAGMLESTPTGLGPLFTHVIEEQFLHIRDADRYWFENTESKHFTPEEISEIKKTKFSDVIRAATGLTADDIQPDVFYWKSGDPCEQPKQLEEADMEECSSYQMFDYFVGSETSYIISFIIVAIIPLVCIFVAYLLMRIKAMRNEKERLRNKLETTHKVDELAAGSFAVCEWCGDKEVSRRVEIRPNFNLGILTVEAEDSTKKRDINIGRQAALDVVLSSDNRRNALLLRVPREYDLIVVFDGEYDRVAFVHTLQQMTQSRGIPLTRNSKKEKWIHRNAVTKTKRDRLLTKFFKHAFAEAYNIKELRPVEELQVQDRKDIAHCELSREEFASSLAISADSIFVRRMFELVDRDNDGYVSFRELLHTILLFSKGRVEDKMRLLFNMYDTDGNGYMNRNDVTAMLRSILDLSITDMGTNAVDDIVTSLLTSVGLDREQTIGFEDFTKLISNKMCDLADVTLEWKGTRAYLCSKKAQQNMKHSENRLQTKSIVHADTRSRTNPFNQKMSALRDYIENHLAHIIFLVFFFSICILIFAERFYFYAIEQENKGLRKIFGYWVSLSRGSAGGMCFTYSVLLLTVCTNTMTWLRGSLLNRYIPFDSYIKFHIIVAYTALLFTGLHVFGYCFTFYQVATQPIQFLCGLDEFVFNTDKPPSFHFWLYGTLAGMTGLLLIIALCIMFVFAQARVRMRIFSAFWFSHRFFYAVYILTLLHGCYRLIQTPAFPTYLAFPATVFALDRLVSLSRRVRALRVKKAIVLPSDVVCLLIDRPSNFHYKSGQWVRLACSTLGKQEFHSLTLSSSPHEDVLGVHVRAVGPWTRNLLRQTEHALQHGEEWPKVYIDGPFGSGQQNWFKYDVSVLIGAGIGIAPYSSILKHFAHLTSVRNTYKMKCRKLYFIWVAPSHKGFEWMVDILRDVEEIDTHQVVETHLFITRFFQQFDLRTTMLYVCEEQFQRTSGYSMFTGLRSQTHFGRPNFEAILEAVRKNHPKLSTVGVFSCGPSKMTKNVNSACHAVSNKSKMNFKHFCENF